ncbi:MAG: RloB family protein [Anaerolineae bacterium]|nr:RloB family protein [Anaerolineae bacterium]
MAKRSRRRARSVASFKRRPGSRPPRQCILIVCEGRQTEPNYFEALRYELKLTSVEVKVVTESGSAPINVVESALRLRRQRERDVRKKRTSELKFDAVWCVFDRETPQDNLSFPRAVDKATSNQLELAVSTPAFEYWYLLHFIDTDRPFRDGGGAVVPSRPPRSLVAICQLITGLWAEYRPQPSGFRGDGPNYFQRNVAASVVAE